MKFSILDILLQGRLLLRRIMK